MVQRVFRVLLHRVAPPTSKHSEAVSAWGRRWSFCSIVQNSEASVALEYFAYNFIGIHRTLCKNPAITGGVSDQFWEVADLVHSGNPPSWRQKGSRK